jgi:hypothetical protein
LLPPASLSKIIEKFPDLANSAVIVLLIQLGILNVTSFQSDSEIVEYQTLQELGLPLTAYVKLTVSPLFTEVEFVASVIGLDAGVTHVLVVVLST